MTTHAHRSSRLLITVLAGLPLLCGAAPPMPRLPADRELAQGTDSPGPVTFSHAQHVGEARPDCTVCHPRLFSMARPVPGTDAHAHRLGHSEMDAGRSCGACHDGRTAFAREDCTACHRAQ
jgi:c(7)-type cytochrome triheme protein